MPYNSGLKTYVIILLWVRLCCTVPVRVPDEMCMLCAGQGTKGKSFLRQESDGCPTPNEVTEEVAKGMTVSLKTARYHVHQELKTLREIYSIPESLSNLVSIDDLTSIENSTFKKHLKTKSKPLYLLQVIYSRTMLISAYTEALGRIYKENNLSEEGLENITHELRTIACTITGLVENLGLRKIKKKLRKDLCNYKKSIDDIRSTDYETSILSHGYKLLTTSIDDVVELVKVTNACTLTCKSSGKLKLRCRKRKQPRNLLKKSRKGRKGKKCRVSKKIKNTSNSTEIVKTSNKTNCRERKNRKKGGNRKRHNKRRKNKQQRLA